MTHYVLGFLFDKPLLKVILIQKLKPKWQVGRLNGVGGKINPNELSLDAMRREWREETGTEFLDWKLFCVMKGPDFFVDCYAGVDVSEKKTSTFNCVSAVTDEMPARVWVESLNLYPIIPNLRWLVPMAKEAAIKWNFQADVCYDSLVK